MSSQITDYTSTRIFCTNFRVNMVAAIDVFSYLSTGFGWLLITYGPLRHISVYIGPSPREGEKKIDERKIVQTTLTRTYKRNRPLPYYYPNYRDAPALKVYPAPSHHPTTPSQLDFSDSLTLSSLSLSLSVKIISCLDSL